MVTVVKRDDDETTTPMIYELKGNQLKLGYLTDDGKVQTPTEFTDKVLVETYKRVKK